MTLMGVAKYSAVLEIICQWQQASVDKYFNENDMFGTTRFPMNLYGEWAGASFNTVATEDRMNKYSITMWNQLQDSDGISNIYYY